MLNFEEFCKENKIDQALNLSYVNYGFYCQGYTRALINNGKD